MISAPAVGTLASDPTTFARVMGIIRVLEPDDYTAFVEKYLSMGEQRFGRYWRYADITTVLFAAAELIRPESYLEIGVRRGRSMAIVASLCPDCRIVGFDWWQESYAGMANPGQEYVAKELKAIGYGGPLQLISGDSHVTVPIYLSENPDLAFDLITVDGDHSVSGALQDLYDVLPRLRIGGIIVFDDISNPYCPDLLWVWRRMVASDERFTCWEFDEVGYGVAVGIRKW